MHFAHGAWLDDDKGSREGLGNWESSWIDDFDATSWNFEGVLLGKSEAVTAFKGKESRRTGDALLPNHLRN